MAETLYVKAEQCCWVTEPDIFLGKVAKMWCKDKTILSKCMAIKLASAGKGMEEERFVFSALDIVKLVQEVCPNVDVQNMGEQDFVVEYKKTAPAVLWWEWTKAVLIFIIVFVGAAFAIITFNHDVSVGEVFQNIYRLVTGENPMGFNILNAGYCIGLAAGILVFYNHFSGKKATADPTPLDVELRSYEKDIYTTVIENESRNESKRENDGMRGHI